VIEYYPEIVSQNPITLYKCDMGLATYTFNLAQNTPIVTQGLPVGTTASYFANQNDANNNINALPLMYTSPS
jgi:hypothetical protein